MARETFSAILEQGSSGFGVTFPLFPGCVSFGRTRREAQHNAVEALELHIAGMLDDKEDIPHEPNGAEDDAGPMHHASDGVSGNQHPIFVTVDVPDDNERVNVYLPKRLIANVDRFAEGAGMNRSSVFGIAVKRYLSTEAGGSSKD